MTDEKHSPMINEDDEERYVRMMQKLQAKHDELFKKIVFAQREDKEDVAKFDSPPASALLLSA